MSSTPTSGHVPAEIVKSVLNDHHLKMLRERGISAEFAISHGLESVDLGGVKASCEKYHLKSPWPRLPLHQGATGLLIPYQTTLDGVARFRVRADATEVTLPGDIDGSHHGETTVKIPRYICQANVPVVPYIPPEVFAIFGDTTKPVFIVEAPLKAMTLTAQGFPAVGLGGVLAGANDKEALDALGEITVSKELGRVLWRDRIAYVTFDAGITDNPMVALGAARLAIGLRREGADVRFVTIPHDHAQDSDLENGRFWCRTDQGPDDYVCRAGVEAFQQLVDAAVPADPLRRFAEAMVLQGTNRAEAVARLLGELPVQAMFHVCEALLVDQATITVKPAGIGKKAIQQSARDFAERLSKRATSDSPSWSKKLRRTPSGAVMGSVFNALLVLTNDDRIKDALGYDELREEPVWTSAPPWALGSRWIERPLTDDDATLLVAWLDEAHDLRIPIQVAHNVLDARAKKRSFHRVREYLARVGHDGVERVAGRDGTGWLTTYLGVPDSPYVRAVGRVTLIAAVARIRQPGCKVDTMLILEGAQGGQKSTSIEALFGSDYFSDQLSELGTKDASADLRGKWVIEWAELDNLSRPEASSVKAYITRTVDDYRPSYGRRNVRIARQCVFVGTVNHDTYLKDETGGRRFLPVRVGVIDIEALRRDRDQLWAEAVALYEAHVPWWFTGADPALLQAAREEQEARRVADVWERTIFAALDAPVEETEDEDNNVVRSTVAPIDVVTSEYVLTRILGIPVERQTKQLQMRVSSVLRAHGWERVRRRLRVGGVPEWCYTRPAPTAPTCAPPW